MNSNIESWRVQQYAANVYQLAQQKGSRLAGVVRNETFKGKAEFFDRIGLATAQKKTGRNSDTPNLDIALSRRMVTTNMYEWATLVDRKDKLENIHSPESEFALAASNALGRAADDVLIDASLGSAMSGESGSTAVVLPNTQKIAAVASAALDYLNLNSLLAAKYHLDAAEAVGPRYLVHRAIDLQKLLGDTKLTSADFNTVKALVAGEIDTFLGFKFIHSERLPLASLYDGSTFKFDTATGEYSGGGTAVQATDKVCFAFVGDGLLLGKNEGMVARISEREDKSYASQVYASMDLGGVRMEEEKVVSILVKA